MPPAEGLAWCGVCENENDNYYEELKGRYNGYFRCISYCLIRGGCKDFLKIYLNLPLRKQALEKAALEKLS